jgi:hypothetical protein
MDFFSSGVKSTALTVPAVCDIDCRESYGKGKDPIPETKVGEEGSAKRNIVRKNNPGNDNKEKKQHGGGGGKGKWNDLDDGTMDDEQDEE